MRSYFALCAFCAARPRRAESSIESKQQLPVMINTHRIRVVNGPAQGVPKRRAESPKSSTAEARSRSNARALAQTFKWWPKNPPESDETTCTTVLGNLLLRTEHPSSFPLLLAPLAPALNAPPSPAIPPTPPSTPLCRLPRRATKTTNESDDDEPSEGVGVGAAAGEKFMTLCRS